MESGSGVFGWWEMTRRGEKGGEYLWDRWWYAMVLRDGVTWRERSKVCVSWPPGREVEGVASSRPNFLF
jgi:hypothetical protein